jgi:hypothetical protein
VVRIVLVVEQRTAVALLVAQRTAVALVVEQRTAVVLAFPSYADQEELLI